MMTHIDSAWRNWYRSQHDAKWALLSGTPFEGYVQSALKLLDVGFINPDPMGRFGDFGCDGLSGDGMTLYACYGSSSAIDGDKKLAKKIEDDFRRAIQEWPEIENWVFVTNAKVGPNSTKLLNELRKEHAVDSDCPIAILIWHRADDFWVNVLNLLDSTKLDIIFPGVPHAQDVELADLVELLDSLKDIAPSPGDIKETIDPVDEAKMEYNSIPPATRLEFNSARSCVRRIDEWFGKQSDPTLRDKKAAAFNRIYLKANKAHSEAREIVEEVYTALGGHDFRLDSKRANAVYVVTTYFFDTCDIFEKPPTGYASEGWAE